MELTCQRVLIINRGQIVAADTPDKLRARRQGGREVIVEIHAAPPDVASGLQALPGVTGVTVERLGEWTGFRLNETRSLVPASFALDA